MTGFFVLRCRDVACYVSTIIIYNRLLFPRCNQQLEHFDGRFADGSAGTEDGHCTGIVEELVVLGGNHTTHGDHDVGTTEFFKLFDDLRHKGLVTCSQRTHAHDVDVVLHGLLGSLGGRLEQPYGKPLQILHRFSFP